MMLTKGEDHLKHTHLLAIDRAHIWHPYTQMKDYSQEDHLLIVQGEGPYLFDHEGNRYYDMTGSWWTTVWGHNHPSLIEAIHHQLHELDHVLFAGCTHPPATRLVESLTKVLHPSLSRFFFSDDGSTAVEVALKMAYQYHKNRGDRERELFIHLKDSYHGDTSGCMSVGGIDIYFSHYRGLMVKTIEVLPPIRKYTSQPPPFTESGGDERVLTQGLIRIEETIHALWKNLAGVIVEPLLMGAAGMQVYSRKYLTRLRELTKEYGILLIFDEVVTGCGRTGRMWAYEHADIVPDILIAAKGITGGMLPLALTITTDEIYYAFYDDYAKGKTFFHGHSYTANPIACAVAHANIELLLQTRILETAQKTWEAFHQELLSWEGIPWVGDVRFIGCVGAVDVVREKRDEGEVLFSPELRIGRRIAKKARQYGLLLRPLGDTIYWLFRLNATEKEVREVVHKTFRAIEETVWEVQHTDAL